MAQENENIPIDTLVKSGVNPTINLLGIMSNGDTKLFPLPILSKTVNTYALMISDRASIVTAYGGVPPFTIEYRILKDEKKGLNNSFYKWFPDNKRVWFAVTDDN